MRRGVLVKEILSVVLAIGFVILLSSPLGPLPPLGNLLNPNGGVWTTAEGANHPTTEEVRLAGLDGDVTVLRDAYGIPHVFATTNHDLFLTLGYVHAEDRLWQMDIQYRFAAGRLSEVLGDEFVEQDTFLRTVGLERDARRFAAAMAPGDIDALALEAYAAGVNAWIGRNSPRNLPLEFKLLDYSPEPWTPVHSLAEGALIAYGLSADFTDVELGALMNGLGQAVVDELFPVDSPLQVPIIPNGTRGGGYVIHPDAARDLLAKARLVEPWVRPIEGIGSNNWIVSGARSATGRPLLAGDPHLRFQLPAVWYEVHLKGGDYDIYGVSFPGIPGVFIGFNRFLANSETNTGADVTDFYRETLSADGKDYLFRGTWRPLNVSTETVKVRGGSDVGLDVKSTNHGPILTLEGEPVSMRWAGREFGTSLKATLLWMKARSWTEFRDALRYWGNPAQNFAVASADGTIAMRSNGLFPIRNNTMGRVPLDGASGDYEWTGWVPFDEYPEAVDPAQGYLASANQLPAGSGYPHYLGWSWDPGYRARRINFLLNSTIAANGSVSFEDMRTFQGDVLDTAAEAFVPSVLNATAPACSGFYPPPWCAAAEILSAWDFRMVTGETAPTIWYTFYFRLVELTFGDEWRAAAVADRATPAPNVIEDLLRRAPSSRWFDDVETVGTVERSDDILQRALADTYTELEQRLGAVGPRWAWGEVHRRVFEHLSGLDALSRGPYPSEGDDVTLNPAARLESRGGPSWRMVVDLSRLEGSVTVFPGGESGNPLSPHYDDQLPIFLAGNYKSIQFPAEAQLSPLESTLILRRA